MGINEKDIVYRELPEIELQARVYRKNSKNRQPIIIDIHGGAWNTGTRLDGVYYDRKIAAANFTVLAIDFRHAPEYQHPTATEDIESAIEYCVNHGKEHGGNPHHIGLIGSSSGGHLALFSGIKSKYKLDYVIALWPVSDPAYRYEYAKRAQRTFLIEAHEKYFTDVETMQSASVQVNVKKGDWAHLPPILVVQPGEDKNVPIEMTQELMHQYQAAGGFLEYVYYPGEEHGFAHFPSATSDECIELLVSFAKRHSHKTNNTP